MRVLLLSLVFLLLTPEEVAGFPGLETVTGLVKRFFSNCECSDWDYVEECGHDCRQYRWRSCEPAQCDVEDERAPCFTVEWGEWSGCDSVTCTRSRKQNCCCDTAIVSPDICMVELRTETEPCGVETKTGDWSECDSECQRTRSTQCMCVDPATSASFPISGSKCGIRPGNSIEAASCDSAVQWAEWSDCDNMCMMRREGSCRCDDPVSGRGFSIRASKCNIAEGHTESRSCQTGWGDWKHLEECPSRLPTNHCHVYVKRFRQCNCIREDSSKFVVGDQCCGREPSKQSVACTNIPEKCTCMVMPGTPAICPRTCDANINGMRVEGSPPVCSCSPDWYSAACDPNLLKPDYKICHAQPSHWGEWEPWSSCGVECTQHRTRKCQCFDGKNYEESPLSLCRGGVHSETRDCTTKWGEWKQKECPDQNVVKQCEIRSAEYRQCFCQANNPIAVSPSKCEGEHFREFECPAEPCQCNWQIKEVSCDNIPAKSCEEHPLYGRTECVCNPPWYQGSCPVGGDRELLLAKGPTMCPPKFNFEWETWSPWSQCNADCRRKRVRKCKCPVDGTYDFDFKKCDGEMMEYQDCPVEWTDWTGGCQDAQCSETTAQRYRKCRCRSNNKVYSSSEEIQEKCGQLDGDLTENVSCPPKPYRLTSWTSWSDECDMACEQKRARNCFCADNAGIHYEETKCSAQSGGIYEEKRECATEWSDWSEPDCGEPTCHRRIRPIYKHCLCKGYDFSVSRERCPGKPWELAVKCPVLPDEQCEDCTCTEWECGSDCKSMVRECDNGCDLEFKVLKEPCCARETEEEEETPCICSEWQCKESCDATMVRTCPNSCDREEKPIAEPCCVIPTTPVEEEEEVRCVCSEWRCKSNCDATMIRNCLDNCDIEEKPIAQPCCQNEEEEEEEGEKEHQEEEEEHHQEEEEEQEQEQEEEEEEEEEEHPHHEEKEEDEDQCHCSEWRCKDTCDATMVRDCHDGCDIEEKAILEPCCEVKEPECFCSEWRCKESCDETMIRSCINDCDIEEKEILEPCCEKEEEPPVCKCSEWRCKPNCDATMVRDCPDSCDIEEKAILEPCCDTCKCSEWGCKESCDASMVRECSDQCDIEEKSIAEPCCELPEEEEEEEEVEEEESACRCNAWVGVACFGDAAGCIEEQWRSCVPDSCDEQIRNSTETECCESEDVIPGDCSTCGKWINVGKCRDGQEGTHQWRSVRNCDRNTCDEFRCVPDGQHCQEELCGRWFDIGDCTLENGQPGTHQWRSAEECFCEPYRCHPKEEDTSFGALEAGECTCTPWEDVTGCDEDCVNTEKRDCTPSGCDEEYRIQAGFCCWRED